MKNETNFNASNISQLSQYDYEKIFRVYEEEGKLAYNIIKTVHIPSDIDPGMVEHTRIIGTTSWTQVSFQIYGTIKLWWLICITNKILNPVLLPRPGSVIRYIKPQYIGQVLKEIANQV